MAGIKFINYIVDTMYYKTNPNFKRQEKKKIRINEDIYAEVKINTDKNKAIITLQAVLEEDNQFPFTFDVKIIGYFEFVIEESYGIEFEDLLKKNAIAILFPYLRAIVSELIGKSNKYPSYNMPVRNIVRELESKDKIKVTMVEDEPS
ncbi:protein-export chaperone SecB [Staphylococcus sp. IVB6246]|uniref:protein-export chaperone SecB n=1 Tax=unclassified Staphylococcus TaxID=91994 RepID=UPI0021D33699|nr:MULTISPECIES: protein-export chaperone SecB [unclassified Staphylococcus]UXR69019.1 protein-export chaperone SecB [Staphylococcus sp. IVB6246]UXR71069.1 protein-export chaperone SecB [Staphylococcus sp. IVB6240]